MLVSAPRSWAGPIPAVENLMAKTGLSIGDFDVIESNEAFAAQALAVNKGLGIDPAKVNPMAARLHWSSSGRNGVYHHD